MVQKMPKNENEFAQLFSAIDDFTDLLLFINDILKTGGQISEILQNSLINFCYIPTIIGGKLSITTSLYLLVSTFVNLPKFKQKLSKIALKFSEPIKNKILETYFKSENFYL